MKFVVSVLLTGFFSVALALIVSLFVIMRHNFGDGATATIAILIIFFLCYTNSYDITGVE